MATCKYCGKSGLLLRVNGIGACSACAKDDNINLQEAWERYADWDNKEGLYKYYRKKIIVDRSMTANGTHLMRLAEMFLERGLYDDARKLLLDMCRRFPEQRPHGRELQFEAMRGMGIFPEEAVQQLAISYLYAAEADPENKWDRDGFLAKAKTVQAALGWTDAQVEGVAQMLADSVAIKNFIESPFIAKYALYREAIAKEKAETAAAPAAEETPAEEPEIEVEIVEEEPAAVEEAPEAVPVEEPAPEAAVEEAPAAEPAPVEAAPVAEAPAEEAPAAKPAPKKRGRKKKGAEPAAE